MAHEEEKPAEGGTPAAAKAPSPWVPLIAVLILMPAISFAATQFLILPRLRTVLSESKPGTAGAKAGDAHGAKAEEAHGGKAEESHGSKGGDAHGGKEAKGKEGKGGGQEGGKFACDFENVVVNLSGSLGTKYLKTSFTFTSSSADLKKIIEENKKRMLDVAITVLSSRSLADLEAPGSKNVVRNDLKARFNDALQSDLIEQIFFTEFVIQ